MGTEITLSISGLDLDWSKNTRGTDHGMLFQENDRKQIHPDQIDYDYFEEHQEDPSDMDMGFSRPLEEIIPRLELLGITLTQIKTQYEIKVKAWSEEYHAIKDDDDDDEPSLDLMSFDEFISFITQYPLRDFSNTFVSDDGPKSEQQICGRFNNQHTNEKIPYYNSYDNIAYSELSYFGNLISFLHPYAQLRLLAENPDNLVENVIWQYGPLVESGWENKTAFISNARRIQSFLIVTEGSSDIHILKHTFSLLRSEIADFFRFIDVSERHPFSGTGSLLKFAEGLVKIDVQNQVVFVFDNDAEGYDTHQKVLALNLPVNIRTMILPDLNEFKTFSTLGPQGKESADINKRAAAIECYLDLNLKQYPAARVRWTNYKKELDFYQGSLEYKDTYTKAFMKQTPETISTGNYDTSKLVILLDSLIAECVKMVVDIRNIEN